MKIDEVKDTIESNFPYLWQPTVACLSVVATLLLEDNSDPVGLNLVGDPSGKKTTVLDFFSGVDGISYSTDNFTPKAFVSHANKPDEELEKIDLLPKIKDKCILVRELAPVFGKRKEDLLENLSILTRVFDGRGYESDSGLKGHRGYEGEYIFAWLGATTPVENHIWKVMGKLGNRWFWWNMGDMECDDETLIDNLTNEVSYKDKVNQCGAAVKTFLLNLFNTHKDKIRWDKKDDSKNCTRFIINCTKLVRKLRGNLQIWKGETSDEYEFETPLIEQPERSNSILYNIARGHAIIHGRKHLTDDDRMIILKIMLSSMPHDRYLLFKALVENNGILYQEDIRRKLNCSHATASRTMRKLEILGLVNSKNDINTNTDKPLKFIEIKEEFNWVLNYVKNI